MATLSDLLERVHDEYPSVPESLALRALSDAAKEFCTRTHGWQEDLDPINVRRGERIVEVDTDSGTMVVALKNVRVLGELINALPMEQLDLTPHDVPAGPPIAFTQLTPSVLKLVREADEDLVLSVRAALTLELGNVTAIIPDDLLNEYGEAIAHGAKMRLVRQANQPWTNPQESMMYASLFYPTITNAKSRMFDALGAAQTRVSIPRW